MLVFKDKTKKNYFDYFISYSDEAEIYPAKMLVSTNSLQFKHQDIFDKTSGGIIIIIFRYFDELLNNRIEKQLVFRMQINNDDIKIFKENDVPKDLEEYLYKHKIILTID